MLKQIFFEAEGRVLFVLQLSAFILMCVLSLELVRVSFIFTEICLMFSV